MKWPSLVLAAALALLSNACEMHKASELEEEPHHEKTPAGHKEGAATENAGKANAGEATPGEAPKFFPEKK